MTDPYALWREAQSACTCGANGRRHTEDCPAPERYRALMLAAGLLRPREPDAPKRGPDEPILPCGLTRRTVESWRR